MLRGQARPGAGGERSGTAATRGPRTLAEEPGRATRSERASAATPYLEILPFSPHFREVFQRLPKGGVGCRDAARWLLPAGQGLPPGVSKDVPGP